MNISSGFPSSPSLYFQFFLGMECKRVQINKTVRSVWFRWQELMYLSEVECDHFGQTSASTSRVNLTSRRATRIRSKELFFETRNEKKENQEIAFCFREINERNYIERENSRNNFRSNNVRNRAKRELSFRENFKLGRNVSSMMTRIKVSLFSFAELPPPPLLEGP